MPGFIGGPSSGKIVLGILQGLPTVAGQIPVRDNYVDSSTISTATSLTYIEQLWRDSSTLATVTTVTSTDESEHPTGFWGPFDNDNGAL